MSITKDYTWPPGQTQATATESPAFKYLLSDLCYPKELLTPSHTVCSSGHFKGYNSNMQHGKILTGVLRFL